MLNVSPIVGLAGSKVMVSPYRQVTRGVAVGIRVLVAEGVLVGVRVKMGADRRVAVGNRRRVAAGRRVAVGSGRLVAADRGWEAVGCSLGAASGETNSSPGVLTGATVAVGWDGCGVAVAVLVAGSVGFELVGGVKVGGGVAVGCGVSVARATKPGRKVPKIRTSTTRKAQPANTSRVTRLPPTTNNRRASWRVCSPFAAL